jgi:hypothetical protein
MTKRAWIAACALVVSVGVGACGDGSPSSATVVGTWSIAGFDDHGTSGTTTGTWTFQTDGTFAADGTLGFPGEPIQAIALDGTYAVRPDTVDLTVAGETTAWGLAFPSSTRAVLSHRDAEGMVKVTLQQ